MSTNNTAAARYEIKLDASLDQFVRDRIEEFFRIEHYAKVLEISTPDGPDILEFKREGRLVSISFTEHQSGHVELVMESESPESKTLFVKAAHWMASDLLSTFLRGLPGCKTEVMNEQIVRCLDDLLDSLDVPSISAP